MGNDSSGVPYAADGATYGFRHNLSANFLFMDGHIEIFRPSEANTFDQTDRYRP